MQIASAVRIKNELPKIKIPVAKNKNRVNTIG